jgi:hypothetical protein
VGLQVDKYLQQGGKQILFKSLSNAPKSVSNKISKEIESTIIEIRKRLSGNLYAQRGASYVVAEIVIERHVLIVMQNMTVHHVFPFTMPLS